MKQRSMNIAIQGMDLTITVRDCTPVEAQKILDDCNKGNRAMSASTVNKLRYAMRHGRFQFNGATVCRAQDGRLIDGQNRLQAIVLSDTTQPIIEITGFHEGAMETMDLGKSRSVADILMAKGISLPSVNEVVSCSSILMLGGSADLREAGKDRTEVAHYVMKHQERLVDTVRWARTVRGRSPFVIRDGIVTRRKCLTTGPLSALSIIMENQGADQEVVREFFEVIACRPISEIRTKDQEFAEATRNWLQKKYPLLREGGSQFSVMLRVMSTLITVYNVMGNPRMSHADRVRHLRLAQKTISSYESKDFNRVTVRAK
jgi:hypothetical protein